MRLGILGAGQLARMLALAGFPLDVRCVFLDPARDACAAPLGEHLCAPFDDESALARLAAAADTVTFEFENVPARALEKLASDVSVFPAPRALLVSQDRLCEKNMFRDLGIPVAPFAAVDSLEELEKAVAVIGLPAVLKTRSLGYDGKGQAVLRRPEDAAAAWTAIGGVPAIVEGFVPFQREVSIVAVRGRTGEIRFYPLTENTHREGILRLSISRPGDPFQRPAEECARALLEALDYVGVLALEMFQSGDSLLANEFAPRVHNSGHWTIEGAQTSQFENHLRAVLNLPLGDTSPVGPAAMVNLIGDVPSTESVLAVPGAHLHLYGKSPRPGRKVGHITLRVDSESELLARVEAVKALAGG